MVGLGVSADVAALPIDPSCCEAWEPASDYGLGLWEQLRSCLLIPTRSQEPGSVVGGWLSPLYRPDTSPWRSELVEWDEGSVTPEPAHVGSVFSHLWGDEHRITTQRVSPCSWRKKLASWGNGRKLFVSRCHFTIGPAHCRQLGEKQKWERK